MKLKNTIKSYGVHVIILGGIIYGIFYAQYFSHKINNCKYNITSCKVYKVIKVTKNSGFGVYYKYIVDGEEFEGYDTEPAIYKDNIRFFLIDRNIPLLYCKSDKKFQEILLLPKDFIDNKLVYPDSLNWVKDYLK